MDLRMAFGVLLKHKWIMLVGVIAGLALAVSSLFIVKVDDGHLQFVRRSNATYTATVPVLVDLPGFGLGRADVSMDKPSRMAPTFAYLVTSQDVLERVKKKIGPIPEKDKVSAVEVPDSPLFQVVVEGNDSQRVAREAVAYAQAVTDYVLERQESSDVLASSRLVLSPLGTAAPPLEVQSRDIEIAAILLLLPILTAGGVAFVLENLSNSTVADADVPATPTGVSSSHSHADPPSGGHLTEIKDRTAEPPDAKVAP